MTDLRVYMFLPLYSIMRSTGESMPPILQAQTAGTVLRASLEPSPSLAVPLDYIIA